MSDKELLKDPNSKWEIFDYSENSKGVTERLKVDGGYLYHVSRGLSLNSSTSMCFVPEVDLQRYQSHLRDAYTKGFNDGQVDAHAQYLKKPE